MKKKFNIEKLNGFINKIEVPRFTILVVGAIFILTGYGKYYQVEKKPRKSEPLNSPPATTPHAPVPPEKPSDEWCPDTLNAGAFEENIKEVSEENLQGKFPLDEE